ncbi:hypothetical protein PUN28_005131 [Cardiocondyla obscurior]|uniref:G-protein coupled receptors family 1 profile domain-containing protein n=1 Tax=Cardiocondyla obscurior TaxID=286306 RepID=A0AAW2GHC4_9HYME
MKQSSLTLCEYKLFNWIDFHAIAIFFIVLILLNGVCVTHSYTHIHVIRNSQKHRIQDNLSSSQLISHICMTYIVIVGLAEFLSAFLLIQETFYEFKRRIIFDVRM